ncbi:MAG TPA: hypothetical protein PKZ16_03280 [bacterium]|nr:hypothetical protein [bacterium]HPL95643.1 hypothetical protein [bacterium]
MYDHINLLIQPSDEFNISKIMKSLKENVARDINYIIFNQRNEGDTSTCRLQIRGSILKFQSLFKNRYRSKIFPKFQWQASFHDHIIRNGKDFLNHYNYTIYNFQKHQLPSDWTYTSLNDQSDLTDRADFWLFD